MSPLELVKLLRKTDQFKRRLFKHSCPACRMPRTFHVHPLGLHDDRVEVEVHCSYCGAHARIRVTKDVRQMERELNTQLYGSAVAQELMR